ncbi:orotidine-5'-phosphate decarboxylase [Marinilactibacillus sp. Marseille-P9653]|uniref:orotidine-5'-phosphate decarboxylase n=1 Tax=Marinilactibacillus sp. Marseille-P9653 TaxID=2866583 RepID=UPI001CE3D0CD|nr:orotidine-5'-phosphate decarboxylase [Marinilactibacillus sp. Marseille-P9653]
MDNKPIIALDFSTKKEVEHFLTHFPKQTLNVKVGMELFYQEGIEIVKQLKESGHDVFLDIKLHDIPTTVYKAMRGLASFGVDMVNVHAAGGVEMMAAAKEGLKDGNKAGSKKPLLIAVTQLTSTTEENMQREQRVSGTLEESVLNYARLSYFAGVDGVVCSVHEAKKVEQVTAPKFLRVTPGIRLSGDLTNDQKRIATPLEAKREKATHIVVGRTITKSKDPATAYQEVLKYWNGE